MTENLTTIIIVGECEGTYINEAVTKEFAGKMLVTARPDGAVIVHNLSAGVRPVCYIDGGAEVSIARNVVDADVELFATTEDGQTLTLQFTEVMVMHGVPEEEPEAPCGARCCPEGLKKDMAQKQRPDTPANDQDGPT
jgi:RecB family endonuclease NucS